MYLKTCGHVYFVWMNCNDNKIKIKENVTIIVELNYGINHYSIKTKLSILIINQCKIIQIIQYPQEESSVSHFTHLH